MHNNNNDIIIVIRGKDDEKEEKKSKTDDDDVESCRYCNSFEQQNEINTQVYSEKSTLSNRVQFE